jgi:hypothetical protein
MDNNFHTELSKYVKAKDNENATRVILNELATSLIKDKENFVEVLRSAGVSVSNNDNDADLIDKFVKNAPTNKGLILGASLLINHRNQSINFDGESEISDAGVKATYKELDEYFNCCGEEHSNVAAAIAGILKGGVDLTNKLVEGKQKKQFGVSDALAKQQDARKQMMQNVIASKQKETDEKNANARKQKKILIIAGASVVGLVLIIGLVMVLKTNKGK